MTKGTVLSGTFLQGARIIIICHPRRATKNLALLYGIKCATKDRPLCHYVLIPLFEQRRVRVKLLVTGGPRSKTRRKTSPVYLPLDLCVRLNTPAGQEMLYPENINRQIDEVLMKYRYDA